MVQLQEIKKDKRIAYGVVFALITIVTSLILLAGIWQPRYNFEVGRVASIDVKAPRDIVDEVNTKAARQEAVNRVADSYIKNPQVKEEALEDVEQFFQIIKSSDLRISNEGLEQDTNIVDEKFKMVKDEINIELSDSNLRAILELNSSKLSEVENSVVTIIEDMYESIDIKEESDLSAHSFIDAEMTKLRVEGNFTESTRNAIEQLCKNVVRPNMEYDEAGTEALKEIASESVESIIVREGQYVVREGDVITEAQLAMLNDLGVLAEGGFYGVTIYMGIAIIVGFTLALQWIYLYKYRRKLFNDLNEIIVISVIVMLQILLVVGVKEIHIYLAPVALVPILITLLYDHGLGLVIGTINFLIMSIALEFNISISVLYILNTILGALFISTIEQRNDIIFTSIKIGLINAGVAIVYAQVVGNANMSVIAMFGIYGFIAVAVSGIIAVGVLPVFESASNRVTNLKLLEIANPNQPLLKRLSIEAPGTYHHSLLVGNLSELAAREVGANPILARVAAYYHDIGKLKNPYFFAENQRNGKNPHDDINPTLSTFIITSHTKYGVEYAQEHNIPKVVRDVIEQHHGDSRVEFFYRKALEGCEEGETIKEEEFCYPGPKPKTKEAAIVMLADSVEAAVRSINDPTKGKVEEMVNNIIKGKLNGKQLDNSELTLRDLNKIQAAFLQGLSGIYHQRIEYPKAGEDKK